ncbi:MAG: glycosyltransferase 87 family protein [Solirubrobacterales bacterium]
MATGSTLPRTTPPLGQGNDLSVSGPHASIGARTVTAVLALVALGAVSVLLAAPGPALVPGAAADAPRWVLGVFGGGLGLDAGAYLAALYAAFALYALFVLVAADIATRVVLSVIAGFLALFALAPPLLSLDVFSYISYARLGVEEGLNPYESVPADIRDDPIASRVDDWRFAVSVYGPVFTLGTYPLGALSAPAALWTLKALTALSVGLLAWVVARTAPLRGVSAGGAAAFVALNPLVLVHVVGGAHNDGFMALAMTAGVAAVLVAAERTGGVLIVVGAAIKAPAILVAPFALLGTTRRRGLLAGLLGAAAAILLVTFAAFGSSAAEALGLVGDNQALSSRWSVPSTFARVTGIDPDAVRIGFVALYVVAVAALLSWVARGADWVRASGWAMLGLLVASTWMVPWYLIWVLPLAAISRDRWLIAGALAMTAFQIINGVPV